MTGSPSLWIAPEPLILASGSVTRRLLLESAGIPVTVCPARIVERGVEAPLVQAGATSDMIALALARAKALAVSAERPGALVLGGDQTLSLDGASLHKPADVAAARRQIALLAGRSHRLNAGAALVRDGCVLFETVESARLTMRPLSPAFIERYIDVLGSSVCDSVGSYKLEGLGIHLFEAIEGHQSTIMGLPLLPVLAALRESGALAT